MSAKNINKLPSTISTEDLLKELESSTEEVEILQAPNTTVSFLLFYNIVPGAFPVKSSVLYKLYKSYTKEYVPAQEFFNEAANYIPKKFTHGSYYFYINFNAFSIADKTFKLINKSKHSTTTPAYKRHFENFVKGNNLESGSFWTSSSDFYEEYKKWCSSINRTRPINKIIFNKFCILYFKEKIVNGKKYYSLNKEICEKETKENNKEKK